MYKLTATKPNGIKVCTYSNTILDLQRMAVDMNSINYVITPRLDDSQVLVSYH